MARYLAEAICKLAAPPLQPSFIRVQVDQGFPTLLLLLHVRPRQLAAGLEVAVYSGSAEDEEGGTASMDLDAPVFAVPRTQAGLERFVANLIAAGPECLAEDGSARLALPTKHTSWNRGWMSVQLDLLPPSEVQGARQAGVAGSHYLRVTVPRLFEGSPLGRATVRNRSHAYAEQQQMLKRRIEEQRRREQGPGSALPQVGTRSPEEQPDSPDAFQAKWRALRDEAMAELKTALLAMLQQALSYRGHITFPVAEGAPAGAAAVAAGVGQQAA